VEWWFNCRQDNKFFCPSNRQDRLPGQPIVLRKYIGRHFFPGSIWPAASISRLSAPSSYPAYRGAGHAGVRGNEIADKLARGNSVQKFVEPEPSLGVCMQNIQNKIRGWVDNQHLAMWRGPGSTQRHARKLILGPSPTS